MKIKVSVKLTRETDFTSESLYYKIKYKIDDQKFHSKITERMATSWFNNYLDYVESLYYYTRKDNVIDVVKNLIKKDIVKKGESINSNNKHSQILKDIKNINKEKIEFEFEIE